MRKIIIILVVLVSLVISGCGKHPDRWLNGEVIEIKGNLPWLVRSPGGILSNETVKIGEPWVVVRIQTSEGVYTAKIFEAWRTKRSLEAVARGLEVGTKVKFVTEKYDSYGKAVTYVGFGTDRIGCLSTDDIYTLD